MHGGFNVPNMSGTLSSRNSSMNSVASGGVQQPTGNVPGGRFASNNIPVALSQMSHGSSHGGYSGITNRGGMNVVGSPGYSNNANGVGGSIPGILPTSAAIGNRNAVPGLGVNPALGNAGPRVTGSVGSMVGSGNIGRSIGSGGGLSVPGLTSRLNMSGNGGSGSLGMQGPNRLTSGVLQQGNVPKFPRVNVWDPYKRLGISPYAAEDEIWSSRNFLAKQYAGDERSVESIEGAFEKLLMRSFWERKRTKINLKTRLKKQVEESPPWFKNLLNFVELPATVIILRRLFLFAFMACWSIMNSAEGGPAFQVAISLGACIYFLNDKTKSLGRAAIIGFGSLVAGWLCGSCLGPMVPVAILPPTWSLELLTSLPVFVSLFLGCTFLK